MDSLDSNRQNLLNLKSTARPTADQIVDQIKVRCPECFKAYQVDINEIRDARPRFACPSCETRFWIGLEEAAVSNNAVIGHLEPQAGKVSTAVHVEEVKFSCPKCGTGYRGGESECKSCGLLFLKFAEHERRRDQNLVDDGFYASREVRHLWEDVLEHYEDEEFHKNFVSAAWVDRSLDYAAHKYGLITQVAPHDELAKKFLKEIQALATVRFEIIASSPDEGRPWWRTFGGKAFPLSFKRFQYVNLIYVVCGALIVMGIALPSLRNLVGFGSALLFFFFALRYFFRVF